VAPEELVLLPLLPLEHAAAVRASAPNSAISQGLLLMGIAFLSVENADDAEGLTFLMSAQ